MVLLLSSIHPERVATATEQSFQTTSYIQAAALPSLKTQAEAVTAAGNLESYVRAYFAETPILAEISWCESRFRQYKKNGEVIRGMVVEDDVGLMQINEYFHKATAEKLGYDLATIDGNLGYAKWLYEREGTKPWNSSAYCWSK